MIVQLLRYLQRARTKQGKNDEDHDVEVKVSPVQDALHDEPGRQSRYQQHLAVGEVLEPINHSRSSLLIDKSRFHTSFPN